MGGGINKNDHEYLTGTFTADFEIIKGLKARAVLGGEVRHEHRFTSHKTYQYVVDNGAEHSDISTASTGGNTKREADDWSEESHVRHRTADAGIITRHVQGEAQCNRTVRLVGRIGDRL